MTAATAAAKALQILHVEDSPMDVELIHGEIRREWPGCQIEVVSARETLVHALKARRFDVILSDFSMPGMTGIEALEIARELQPETPYIFLSGTIGEDLAVDALKRGATDYVIKDRMGRLIPALRRALAEMEARQKQRELEHQYLRAQRMESLGLLAGGIAHDLNNVLAPILMAVNLLQQRMPGPESERLLTILEKSAKHGAGLIRQVLAFAKGVEGERTELQPAHVIRDVEKLMGATFPRSIVVQVDMKPRLWLVKSDATQLGQVILNLCVNARDAMEKGGRLTLRAENLAVDAATAAEYPGAHPGPHVRIAVEDTGSGIAPEIIDRIFDPFFTTKPTGKGTGLGLSTVLGIVKSHGGFLQLRSTLGEGTEVALCLPAAAETANGDEEDRSARRPALPLHSGTLLLIEDDEGLRDVTRMLLEEAGFSVVTAENGEKGLEQFVWHVARIDAVVIDLLMPVLGGVETIRRMQALVPKVRVVAMSGAVPKDLLEVPGRVVFMKKPAGAEELIKALEAVLPPRAS